MFQYSYLPQELYRSPYVQAIAGATGGADRARAAAEQQQGQIASQAASSIGNIASGTLHDFLNYKLDQPRRDLVSAQAGIEKAKLTDIQKNEADDKAMREALQASGGDHDAALATLDARGAIGPATKLRTALTTERTRAIDEQTKVMDLSKKRLGMASQMLQGIPESDDPWTSYAEVLPKVRAVVGPELGKALPDDYDPDRVGQAITWGQTAQELLERRRAALETAKEGVANAKDAREKDSYFTTSLAQWLPTVSNQEEWTQALAAAKTLGAPPETLAKFGDTYTPEAAKRAESFGLTAEERAKGNQPPKAGTIEDYMTTYARDVAKKPVGALTVQDKDAALKRFAQDHKVDANGELTSQKRADLVDTILKYPSVYHDLTDTTKSAIAADLAKAGFTAFERQATPATIAAAERWRAQQLAELDKRYRAAQALPDLNGAMSPEDLQAAKDEIQASYRAQTGNAKPSAAPAGDHAGDPSWTRGDGTPKGNGFLGVLKRPDGKVSSEISIGVMINGKETEVPTLVPTLTADEKNWLLTHDISDPSKIPMSIQQKAIDFAKTRIAAGKSPFAGPGDSPAAASAKPPVKAAVVPPAVGTVLQGQKPGKYTLSDGSKWVVGRDGTVQPGQ